MVAAACGGDIGNITTESFQAGRMRRSVEVLVALGIHLLHYFIFLPAWHFPKSIRPCAFREVYERMPCPPYYYSVKEVVGDENYILYNIVSFVEATPK